MAAPYSDAGTEFYAYSGQFCAARPGEMCGGGTAYFGVISDLVQQGAVTANQINASAGLLIQTFDLPGIGIFLGISSRFVRLFRYVIPAALIGILIRTVLHIVLF